MKLKKNYVLRKVADTWVVLPLDDQTMNFNGMLTLNESGAFIWKTLEKSCTREELIDVILNEYAVPRDQALKDLDEFLLKIIDAGCLETE